MPIRFAAMNTPFGDDVSLRFGKPHCKGWRRHRGRVYTCYMTRRDLGKLAGATALLQKQAVAADTPKYTGALDGFLDKVSPGDFDPVRFTQRLYESAALRMTFQAQNRQDAGDWHMNLRAKIVDLLGGFPAKRPP